MMKLRYSTELEEIAYSKSASALFEASDHVIQPQNLEVGKRDAAFFDAGIFLLAKCLERRLGGGNNDRKMAQDVHWFTWHGDEKTALFFHGDYGDVVKRVRALDDRTERA